jgi:hypothetical protein
MRSCPYPLWSVRAIEFQKVMVFIDGTNLFHRLDALKLNPVGIDALCKTIAQGRDIVRIYLYTSEPHYKNALAKYGDKPFRNIRVVFGDAVSTGNGNFREKGVDAPLSRGPRLSCRVEKLRLRDVVQRRSRLCAGIKTCRRLRMQNCGCINMREYTIPFASSQRCGPRD